MNPTLRRSRDDVFLIGEESLLPTQEIGPDTEPESEMDGRPSRPSHRPHLPGSLHGARGLALVGLGAGAAALLTVLELGGGSGPARPTPTSSPRSPLISRSAAALPAAPATRVHHPDARPVEVHRPAVHHRPRHTGHQVSTPSSLTEREPEREPTIHPAPVSSTTVSEAEATPAPEQAVSAATTPATPPGPPPSSSGGGSRGVESFGFER